MELSLKDQFLALIPPRSLAALLIFALLYTLIFNRYLFAAFGFHNDYIAFTYDTTRCCLGFHESLHLFWIGRPLGALLLNIQFIPLVDLTSLKWARLGSLIMAAAIAALAAYSLARISPRNRMAALLFALLVFTLPSYLLYILWLTNLVPGVIAVGAAIVAYLLIDSSFEPAEDRKLKRRSRLAAGLAVLFAAFLIYPPNAYFYLVLTCWRAAFGCRARKNDRVRRAMFDFGLIGSMSVAYLLAVKLLTAPLVKAVFDVGRKSRSGGAYTFDVTRDLGRVVQAGYDYLETSAELWLVGWSNVFAIVAVTAVLLALLLTAVSLLHDRSVPTFTFPLAAILTAIAISSGPVALSSAGEPYIRNVFVTATLIALMLFVLAIETVKNRVIQVAMYSLTAAGIFMASTLRIGSAAENAVQELNFVRSALTHFPADSEAILVRQPPMGAQLVPIPQSREFANLALNVPLQHGIIRGVLRELGQADRSIAVHALPWGTPELKMDKGVLIDATGYYRATKVPRPAASGWTLSTVSRSRFFTPIYAFDGDPSTFWEVESGFPAAVEIHFNVECLKIDGYSVTASDIGDRRSPRAWTLIATDSRGETTLLDAKSGEVGWQPQEVRKYNLVKPSCVSTLRFEVAAGEHESLLRIAEIELHMLPRR